MTRPRKRRVTRVRPTRRGRPSLADGERALTTSVRLYAEDRERLERLSAQLECSESQVIRAALEELEASIARLPARP